jgi:hypothetical protein
VACVYSTHKAQQNTSHDSRAKRFSLDFAEIKPAVVSHKINDGIELLVNKAGFAANNGNADDRACLAVLMFNL